MRHLPTFALALAALALAAPALAAGGDGDPCTPDITMLPLGDPAACDAPWLCHYCDPLVFGAWQCHCFDAEDNPQECATYVCLSYVDACTTTIGMCWDPEAQSCYQCASGAEPVA